MTRALCSGMPGTRAHMSRRGAWGGWDGGVLVGEREGELGGGFIEARHAGPRLHGVGDQPLVDDALLHGDGSVLECGVGGGSVTEGPLEGHVPGRAGMKLRGATGP